MSFKNIFDGGQNEAKSAEGSARNVHERIPGFRPDLEGVDPELLDGIPEVVRDPKLIRETSPEALDIMNNFIVPLFQNTQTVAAKQRDASENPESTSDIASAAKDEAFKKVVVEIGDEDRPKISDEEREELARDDRRSAATPEGNGQGTAEG